jgi:hypothetical protein
MNGRFDIRNLYPATLKCRLAGCRSSGSAEITVGKGGQADFFQPSVQFG